MQGKVSHSLPPTAAAANVVVVAAPAAAAAVAAAAVHEPAGGVQGHVLEVQHRVQELMREEDSEEEEEVQEEVQEGQEEVQEDLRPLRSLILCRGEMCATKKIGESERKRLIQTRTSNNHPDS